MGDIEDERFDPLGTQRQQAQVPRRTGGSNPNGDRYSHRSSVLSGECPGC
jgi:hypothetical protein